MIPISVIDRECKKCTIVLIFHLAGHFYAMCYEVKESTFYVSSATCIPVLVYTGTGYIYFQACGTHLSVPSLVL